MSTKIRSDSSFVLPDNTDFVTVKPLKNSDKKAPTEQLKALFKKPFILEILCSNESSDQWLVLAEKSFLKLLEKKTFYTFLKKHLCYKSFYRRKSLLPEAFRKEKAFCKKLLKDKNVL